MLKIADRIVLSVPAWAIGYLINDTKDNLTPVEIEMCDDFLIQCKLTAEGRGASNYILDVQDREYFYRFPVFGQPAMCVDLAVLFVNGG